MSRIKRWRRLDLEQAVEAPAVHQRCRSFLVGRRNADRLHVTCATPMPEDEITVVRALVNVTHDRGRSKIPLMQIWPAVSGAS